MSVEHMRADYDLYGTVYERRVCPSEKLCYASEQAAMASKRGRAVNCEQCGWWHVVGDRVLAPTRVIRTCRSCNEQFEPGRTRRDLCYTCAPSTADLKRHHAHGLTRAQYDALLERSGGCCEICHRLVKKLFIDHDHRTDRRRGLLCPRCNAWMAAVDAEGWLEAAQAYLRL